MEAGCLTISYDLLTAGHVIYVLRDGLTPA